MLIPFGEYTPDMPDFQNPGSSSIRNCLPRSVGSYGPMPSWMSNGTSLQGNCIGAMFTRDKSGNVVGVAGTPQYLQLYTTAAPNWVDATRTGTTKAVSAITKANPAVVTTGSAHGWSTGQLVYITGVVGMTQINGTHAFIVVSDATHFSLTGVNSTAYSVYSSGGTVSPATVYTAAVDARWSFAKDGERIIATDYSDNIQSYLVGTDTFFSDLSAGAPKARYAAMVRDFCVVANTNDGTFGARPQRVWWPALGDSTNWPTPGTAAAAQVQSDYQDLLGDGGWNQGLVGGLSGADMAVIQERKIWRGAYVGSPAIFAFSIVDGGRGTPAPGSIVQVGGVFYFLSDSGFFGCDGAQVWPIGDQKVDKTFWGDVNTSYLYNITAAVDPLNKLVFWSYPGSGAIGGAPNKLLAYHYAINRWSLIDGNQYIQCLCPAYTVGYNLDQLNPFGTLETLPYSLDSRAWTGGRLNLAGFSSYVASTGAFNAVSGFGYFSGGNLAATIDTSEANLNDKGIAHVNRVWPMVDSAVAQAALGYRSRLADPVNWTAAAAMSATTGSVGLRGSGMYHRSRVTIPAGAYWTHAQGVQFDARRAGHR